MGLCMQWEVLGTFLIQTLPCSLFSCQFMGRAQHLLGVGMDPRPRCPTGFWEGLLLSLKTRGVYHLHPR